VKLLNNQLNVIIVVLVVVALGLGLAIYSQSGLSLPKLGLPTKNASPSATNKPTNIPTPTAAEKAAILTVPGPNASASEKSAYFQLVAKFASPAGGIEVTNCDISPLVLLVKNNATYTIQNLDSTKHRIQVNDKHIYEVAANSTVQATADMGGAGIHGFFCDTNTKPTGILFVIP
jgi:hypothetical protein